MKRAFAVVATTLLLLACSEATEPVAPSPSLDAVVTGPISPASGPLAGGNTVVISGTFPFTINGPPNCYYYGWGWYTCNPTYYDVSYSVTIGGAAASVQYVTSAAITVRVPRGSTPGTVPVIVTACTYSYAGCWTSLSTTYTYENPNRAPVANAGGPYTGNEGSAVALDASHSSDPDNDPITVDWDFGDGSVAPNGGLTPSHTYADNGTFTVTITVRDNQSHSATASAGVTVTNVAPSVSGIPGAEIMQGETYATSGSFTDPGADTYTATVDFEDGTSEPLTLTGSTFNLNHTYANAGTFTITVSVTDDDGGIGTTTATVIVLSPAGAAQALGSEIQNVMNEGALPPTVASPLLSSVNAAAASLASGNTTAASGQLGAFMNKIQAAMKTGKISVAVGGQLITYAQRVLHSIGG